MIALQVSRYCILSLQSSRGAKFRGHPLGVSTLMIRTNDILHVLVCNLCRLRIYNRQILITIACGGVHHKVIDNNTEGLECTARPCEAKSQKYMITLKVSILRLQSSRGAKFQGYLPWGR